jgi:glycosyltransferase involved in cell wall biosynthesis
MGTLKPSGMERMLVSSYKDWVSQGWHPTVIGYEHENTYGEKIESAGYRVNVIPRRNFFLYCILLFGEIRRGNFEVIHVHIESKTGFVSLIARLAAPRSVIVRTIHNVFENEGLGRKTRQFNRILSKLTKTKFVAPGSEVAANEKENWNTECTIIENWVDGIFQPGPSQNTVKSHWDKEVTTFGIIGNCSVIKNHQLVFKAIEAIKDVRIIHIGEESAMPLEEIASLVNDKVNARVSLLGNVDSVIDEIVRFDCMLVPSLREGFSVAILEVLCMGIPVIARNSPGLRWLRDIPGTILVDSDVTWSSVIGSCRNEKLEMLSKAALANSEILRKRFSSQNAVQKYIDIYEGN